MAGGSEQLHFLGTQLARATAEDAQHPQHFVLGLDGNASESVQRFPPAGPYTEPGILRGLVHHDGLSQLGHLADHASAQFDRFCLFGHFLGEPAMSDQR